MMKPGELEFQPTVQQLSAARDTSPFSSLSGSNNSGKSLLLKAWKHSYDKTAYLIGTNRFYHVPFFSTAQREENQLDQFESQSRSHFGSLEYNYEYNYFELSKVITGLKNRQRDQLFGLCGDLIGAPISMRKVDSDNDLSQDYIDVGGQNLSVSSTGTRLLVTTLGICMDERFTRIFIDEPELGLAPRIQNSFAQFIQDAEARRKQFPHLKQIVVATHSHLFLDRNDISNNFIVNKSGPTVTVTPVANMLEFHRLQFNLLGNSLEQLFVPSALVIVEGKTDVAYVERLLAMRFPDRRITVIPGQGDVKRRVQAVREIVGDLPKSPYRGRLFVVLDSIHQPGLIDELVRMGVVAQHVCRWDRNGIEYVYPKAMLAKIYSTNEPNLDQLQVIGDIVRLGDIEYTKAQLSQIVCDAMTPDTALPVEVEDKLLGRIANAIG